VTLCGWGDPDLSQRPQLLDRVRWRAAFIENLVVKNEAGPLSPEHYLHCLATCWRSFFSRLTSTRVPLLPLLKEALPMPIT
jgi:hypothetical protein